MQWLSNIQIQYCHNSQYVLYARHRYAIKYTTSQFRWIAYQHSHNVISNLLNRTVNVRTYCCNIHILYYTVSHAISGSCVCGKSAAKMFMKSNGYAQWLRWACSQLSAEPVELHYSKCQRGKVILRAFSGSSHDRIVLTPESEISIRTLNTEKLNILRFVGFSQ